MNEFRLTATETKTITSALKALPYAVAAPLLERIASWQEVRALEAELLQFVNHLADGDVYPANFTSAFAEVDGHRFVFRTLGASGVLEEGLESRDGSDDLKLAVDSFKRAVTEYLKIAILPYGGYEQNKMLFWRRYPTIDVEQRRARPFYRVTCRLAYVPFTPVPVSKEHSDDRQADDQDCEAGAHGRSHASAQADGDGQAISAVQGS